jgi:hypothetical protein
MVWHCALLVGICDDIPEFFALVQELFTPEEAEINNVLPRNPTSVGEIAARLDRRKEEVERILERMAGKVCAGSP